MQVPVPVPDHAADDHRAVPIGTAVQSEGSFGFESDATGCAVERAFEAEQGAWAKCGAGIRSGR